MIPVVNTESFWQGRYEGAVVFPVHRHASAYATFVLDGGYEEYGPDGRFVCRKGTLVVHPPWHVHGDCVWPSGAKTLNFTLPAGELNLSGYALGSIPLRVKTILKYPATSTPRDTDAPERSPGATRVEKLRACLMQGDARPISAIAQSLGMSAAHASRAFRSMFGVPPSVVQNERRLRQALTLIRKGSRLAEAAAATGFADQSHMCRCIKQASGLTPREHQICSRQL